MGMEKYSVLQCVGEGSFGRVYRGRIKSTGHIVAMKFIPKVGKTSSALKNLKREIEIMRSMQHENIIQMIDSFETDREVVAVTDYAEGDLFQIIEDDGKLPEEVVRSVACQLVSALYYLHAHRILHRDMKPQNILLAQEGVVKLCDFGFARVMNLNALVLTSIKGTPLYMAPELVEEKPYDHTTDLWALGCILYEMFVGTPPFYTTSIFQLVKMITKTPINWPSEMSINFKDFLARILQKDVQKRLQWHEILQHPFVADGIKISQTTLLMNSPFTQQLTPGQMIEKQQQMKLMLTPNGQKVLRRISNNERPMLRLTEEDCRDSTLLKPEGQITGRNSEKDREIMSKRPPRAGDMPEEMKLAIDQRHQAYRNRISPRNHQVLPIVEEIAPTPREDRISTDYLREMDVHDRMLKAQEQRKRTSIGHTLDQVMFDTSDEPRNDANRSRKHNSAGVPVHTDRIRLTPSEPAHQQQQQCVHGWWLRESTEAWERLVDTTEMAVNLPAAGNTNDGSRKSAELMRDSQRRTVVGLLGDADFARRLALRLASASVIDRQTGEGCPWPVALVERRSSPRLTQRPASAELTGSSGRRATAETIPGLEAASYFRNILRLITNIIIVKCDVGIVVRFCEITEMPDQVLKLIGDVLECKELRKRPWFEEILLDLIIAINAYFVSEIGHKQTTPDSAINNYSVHALKFIELTPELLSIGCDQDFHVRDQTLLCIRYIMERMVERKLDILKNFYAEIISKHLRVVKALIHMPSTCRQGPGKGGGETFNLDEVREHALAALTAFTFSPDTVLGLRDNLDPSVAGDNWASPLQLTLKTHEIASHVARQLCQPEMTTHLRLYISYLWMPRLAVHTAKLFYDCIQAEPAFSQYCLQKFPDYLNAMFDLLQKKVTISHSDQMTLTEIVINSLTSITIQLGTVPDPIHKNLQRLCNLFVESQMPSHAAALALLLSRIDRSAFSTSSVQPGDIAKAISLVLVSPLVQGQEARTRLLLARSEGMTAVSIRPTSMLGRTSVEMLNDLEAQFSFGLPQLNWPANYGWLDGIFALAYMLCLQFEQAFIVPCIRVHLFDRVWPCLQQIFDLSISQSGSNSSSRQISPDWSMLSPYGLIVLIKWITLIYTQDPKLFFMPSGDVDRHAISSMAYLLSPNFLQHLQRNSVWTKMLGSNFVIELLASTASLLQIPLIPTVAEPSLAIAKEYLENDLLANIPQCIINSNLLAIARQGWGRSRRSVYSPTDAPAPMHPVHLGRLHHLLYVFFRVSSLPFLLNRATGSGARGSADQKLLDLDAKVTGLIRKQLQTLFLQDRRASVAVDVSKPNKVCELINWCLRSRIVDLQAGACQLLNQVLITQPLDQGQTPNGSLDEAEAGRRCAGHLLSMSTAIVWSILKGDLNDAASETPTRSSQLLLEPLLAEKETAVAVQSLHLLANLLVCHARELPFTSTGGRTSHSSWPNLQPSYNKHVIRPPNPGTETVPASILKLPDDGTWEHLYKPLVLKAVQQLDSTDGLVKQAAILVLGNALVSCPQASTVVVPAVSKLVLLVNEGRDVRVRANAACTLGNFPVHSKQMPEELTVCNVPNCLLDTACLDGDRQVQDAALSALRYLLSSYSQMHQPLQQANAYSRLTQLQNSLKPSPVSNYLGRRLANRLRPTRKSPTGPAEYDSLVDSVTAILAIL